MSFVWRFSRICRTSRCSIDSVPPVGDASRGRNCLLRPSLLSGHSLLPDPPDSNMSCICCFYLLCGKSSNFCQAAKRYFCKSLVTAMKSTDCRWRRCQANPCFFMRCFVFVPCEPTESLRLVLQSDAFATLFKTACRINLLGSGENLLFCDVSVLETHEIDVLERNIWLWICSFGNNFVFLQQQFPPRFPKNSEPGWDFCFLSSVYAQRDKPAKCFFGKTEGFVGRIY